MIMFGKEVKFFLYVIYFDLEKLEECFLYGDYLYKFRENLYYFY